MKKYKQMGLLMCLFFTVAMGLSCNKTETIVRAHNATGRALISFQQEASQLCDLGVLKEAECNIMKANFKRAQIAYGTASVLLELAITSKDESDLNSYLEDLTQTQLIIADLIQYMKEES